MQSYYKLGILDVMKEDLDRPRSFSHLPNYIKKNYPGWRLPTINELKYLYNLHKLEILNFVNSEKIDTLGIKNYHQSIWDINTNIGYKDMTEIQYWSSTHNNRNGGEFVVSFDSGIIDMMIPAAPRFVRLVRDSI
jgi:hypothetical protein